MVVKKKMKTRTLEERLRIAREINVARAAAPRELIANIVKKFPGISESNYWAWNKRLELAEAHRKANDGMEAEQHFPLSVIPPKPAKKVRAKKESEPVDDTKELVALMLEVASKLLKR